MKPLSKIISKLKGWSIQPHYFIHADADQEKPDCLNVQVNTLYNYVLHL